MQKFNLGDRIFKSRDSGGRLELAQPTLKNIRWSNAATPVLVPIPLVALADNANVTLDIPVSSSNSYVTVISFAVNAIFSDSGVANYNVSERVSVSPLAKVVNNDNGNVSFSFPNKFANNPMNLQVQVTAGIIQVTVVVTGGDVKYLTGITPGAGDGVSFDLSISYIY